MGYFMDDIKTEAIQKLVYNTHKITGITVLLVIVIRLLWKFMNVQPVSLNETKWERFLEHSLHWLLYLILIFMPLSGWLRSSAAGRAPQLFDWTLSLPVAKSTFLADVFAKIHNTLAIVIIVLVSLHVLAALYHYIVKKDQVLQRML
jgi:cytochrome b561